MHRSPRFPASPRSHIVRDKAGQIDSSVGGQLPQNTPNALSLPGFASFEALAQAGQIRADRPRRHDAINLRQQPSPEQQSRTWIKIRQDVIASIETPPFQTSYRRRTAENVRSPRKITGRDGYRPISDVRGCSDSTDCEQLTGSKTKGMPPRRLLGLKRRRKRPFSSSPSLIEHVKMPRTKIIREKDARSKQARCLQNAEDFLRCVLSWEAPKKQRPGNVEKSGLVGDKQQTLEAFYILTEVFVRHTISPLRSKPGESPLQTTVREAQCRIEAHFSDHSDVVLPNFSLMAGKSAFGDRSCTGKCDHEPPLLDRSHACIECRKQRRVAMFKRNLEELAQ